MSGTKTENELIAAHLAAALITRSKADDYTPEMAVKRYNQVLELLDQQDAERRSAGVDSMLKAYGQ